MTRVTGHSELQQVEDWENSLAMLFGRQDYRDYFEREGLGAFLAWRVPDFSTVSIHVRNDEYSSLPLDHSVRSWFQWDRDLRENPPVDEGEIRARGYGVMLGYHEDPAATAAAIDAEGWLRTGDIGTMDARGYVRVTGRVKEMIIRGGENLFPAEIENILLEHPDVAEVAVVGVPDPYWGEAVAAFVPAPAVAFGAVRAAFRRRASRLRRREAVFLWIVPLAATWSSRLATFRSSASAFFRSPEPSAVR